MRVRVRRASTHTDDDKKCCFERQTVADRGIINEHPTTNKCVFCASSSSVDTFMCALF